VAATSGSPPTSAECQRSGGSTIGARVASHDRSRRNPSAGMADHCIRELDGPESRHPSAVRARRNRLERHRPNTTQQPRCSASFQSAAWDWEAVSLPVGLGRRGNTASGGLGQPCSGDEATVSGAANISSPPSGSHGTEANGSLLRNTPARVHQHGTAHRTEPALGLAAAPTQQPAA
jgi:hypothetical protein